MTNEKAKKLRENIKKCKSVLAKKNPSEAMEEIQRIKRIYRGTRNFNTDIYAKIQQPKNLFDTPHYITYPDSQKQLEFLKDLIDEMEIYLAELNSEKDNQPKHDKIASINIHNNNTANAIISQNISLETTIKSINKIPREILDKETKEKLKKLLCELDPLKEKDKEKVKNKTIKTLKYIADKGIDAIITCLPYLCEVTKFLR